MKHKFYRGVLALTLMGAILTGCGGETPNSGEKDTKIFTDSLGREVTLPVDVEKIAVTGPLSQTYVLPLGGDMMVAKGVGDLTLSLKFLKRLSEEFTVICANGNHEIRLRNEKETYGDKYREYRRALNEMGITFLSDRKISLDQDIDLYGVNLLPEYYGAGYPKMKKGFMEKVLGRPDVEKFSVLLAHSPMFFDEYAEWGADLTLSGHFHGGTIQLPLLGGLMTPQYQFFFPWCAGLYEGMQGRKLIVGRGLGTHSINIRFNDKPQVVVVDVTNKNKI